VSRIAATSVTGLSLGRAKRSSHRCRRRRCSKSSEASTLSGCDLATGTPVRATLSAPPPVTLLRLLKLKSASHTSARFCSEEKRRSAVSARGTSIRQRLRIAVTRRTDVGFVSTTIRPPPQAVVRRQPKRRGRSATRLFEGSGSRTHRAAMFEDDWCLSRSARQLPRLHPGLGRPR
jgi:hypothetical protein